MFESVTGSFTDFASTGIVVPGLTASVDELQYWTISITCSGVITEYPVAANQDENVYFSNAISEAGTFSIDFVTRADLAKIENEIASTAKFPNTLVANKIESTKAHFAQKIKVNFKNLYFQYPELADPMSLIINLREVRLPFIYFCIADCYSDTTLTSNDMNVYNEDKYRRKYKDLMTDALSMLAADTEVDGSLSNEDLGNGGSQGVMLSR